MKKAYSLLSLCRKAGKLYAGEAACEKALRAGDAKLVIISHDASDNTKKKFVNKAFYYKVPFAFFGTKETLGKAIGSSPKSSLVISDSGFFEKMNILIGNVSENGTEGEVD